MKQKKLKNFISVKLGVEYFTGAIPRWFYTTPIKCDHSKGPARCPYGAFENSPESAISGENG